MSSERLTMTAQEWSNLYGHESASKSGRFWLLVVVVLVIGVTLGSLILPGNLLTRDVSGILTANSELESGGAEVEAIRTTVSQDVATASNEVGAPLSVDTSLPALVYTVRSPETNVCADFVAFTAADGSVRSVRLADPYTCAQ